MQTSVTITPSYGIFNLHFVGLFLIVLSLAACGSGDDEVADSNQSSASQNNSSNILASSSDIGSHSSEASRSSGPQSSSQASSIIALSSELQEHYAQKVEPAVVQANCIACHVQNGAARATNLVFTAGTEGTSNNQMLWVDYLQASANANQFVLAKVRGENSHGGGSRFSSGSTQYRDLEFFVNAVVGDEDIEDPVARLFKSVNRAPELTVLRRASLLLAGRLPTSEEKMLAQSSEAELRSLLKTLMDGDKFHAFIIRNANDRLLTDGLLEDGSLDFLVFDPFNVFYPNLANKKMDAEEANDLNNFYIWLRKFRYGAVRAPLELIAHVIENDLPYTQILTADYTMVNPQVSEILNSGLTFDDPDDHTEFKVGTNQGQVIIDAQLDATFVDNVGVRVNRHGSFLSYPHAGLLNEPAFLNRYPSTDTNRNRARARWTYYHFLGIDIEKSASRTTDPTALADTNNPTLNNPNCAVCHSLLDPLAGTFQNFGDEGFYRDGDGGFDSLAEIYKEPDDGQPNIYQVGDTWYRDMRNPGYNGNTVPKAETSLQWLAQQLSQSIDFAKAAVKFWWPALMNEDLASLPENPEDNFYAQQLLLHQAQQASINELANQFVQGFSEGPAYNVKDLLVELMLSRWFAAESSSEAMDSGRQRELQGVGLGRLLTPAELENKAHSLFGYRWGESESEWEHDSVRTNLSDLYNIYYGGIDSVGIVDRAREQNSLMSNVALAQALSMSCPGVVLDFREPAENRQIFTELEKVITPLTQGYETFNVTGQNTQNQQTFNVDISLPSAASHLHISFNNPYWDATTQQSTLLIIHNIVISNEQGESVFSLAGGDIGDTPNVVLSRNSEDSDTSSRYFDESSSTHTGWVLWSGFVDIPISLSGGSGYTVSVSASRLNFPDREVLMTVALNASSPTSGSWGEQQIRRQLAAIHSRFLGEELALDHAEITASYVMLVELWQERKTLNLSRTAIDWDNETCQIPIDNWWEQDWSKEFNDPEWMLGAWISTLIYFMTDFKFLHE